MRMLVGVLFLALTSLAACHTVPPVEPPPKVLPFPQGWDIVDLTRPLDWRAPALPHPDGFPFERIDLAPVKDSNRRTGGFTSLEQMGTHVAAPRARGGSEDVASLVAADLVLPLVVVDVPSGGAGGYIGIICIIKKYKVMSFPPRVGVDTTAEFESVQEFMTQERIAIARQFVPVYRIDLVDLPGDL